MMTPDAEHVCDDDVEDDVDDAEKYNGDGGGADVVVMMMTKWRW